jgi:multiple sugar transport system substrate-binding protein
MKKLWTLGCLCMVFAVLLSACGGGGDATSSSGSSNQPVTLRYMIWDQNQVPAMNQIIT